MELHIGQEVAHHSHLAEELEHRTGLVERRHKAAEAGNLDVGGVDHMEAVRSLVVGQAHHIRLAVEERRSLLEAGQVSRSLLAVGEHRNLLVAGERRRLPVVESSLLEAADILDFALAEVGRMVVEAGMESSSVGDTDRTQAEGSGLGMADNHQVDLLEGDNRTCRER